MIWQTTETGTAWYAKAGGVMRRIGRRPALARGLWLVNIASFLSVLVWILRDGRLADAMAALPADVLSHFARDAPTIAVPYLATRLFWLKVLGLLAVGSSVGIFVALFVGAQSHRRIRSWFAFTLMVAAWLTLGASWRELAWRGQVLRLGNDIDAFEPMAASLRADWPAQDGERPGLGPFMAYPIGDPQMIMMLAAPELPNTSTTFSAVERGADALRFQLAGDESGTWLEWHAGGSVPRSFVGGLLTDYRLERSAPLGHGWFITRYRPERLAFDGRPLSPPEDN